MSSEAQAATPLDADDTRGLHLRALAGNPWVLSITSTLSVVGFAVATSQAGAGVGAAVGGGVLLLAAILVFAIAGSRAKEDFFDAYATARGLNRNPKGSLPPATPLLRKGDRRYAEQIMNGTLPGGLPGALALYTYEERHRDSDGDEDVSYHRFTVVMHDLPATAQKVEQVACQRRSGFGWMDSMEDAFRRMKRLELESVALDERYEIFYGASDDEGWLKQLFSPSFVVWLAEQAPERLGFELSARSLCVNVTNHHDGAAELDELCDAAGVIARRLAEEAAE